PSAGLTAEKFVKFASIAACFAACVLIAINIFGHTPNSQTPDNGTTSNDQEYSPPNSQPPDSDPPGSSDESISQPPPSFFPFYKYPLPNSLDFSGSTIKFLVCDGDDISNSFSLNSRSILPNPEIVFYEIDSALFARNEEVEKALNVRIEMDTCYARETITKISDCLAADIHLYDVIGAYQYYDMGLTIGSNGGFFVNFENEELQNDIYIDITKPYWDKELYDLLTLNGIAYWVTGDITLTHTGSVFVSYVNKNLWEQYADVIAGCRQAKGYSDPYELIENGYWTIDLWQEISKKMWIDRNDNEIADPDDVTGFLTYGPGLENIMADALAAGAGVTYATLSEGEWKIDFETKRNMLFATILAALYSPESAACLISFPNHDEHVMEYFAKGNSLMTVNTFSAAEKYLSHMEDEYYILPLPKLVPGTSERHTTCTHDNLTLFGIPKTAVAENKLAAITATLELMAYQSKREVDPLYRQAAIGVDTRTEFARQERMLEDIFHSVKYDFGVIYGPLILDEQPLKGSVTHFFRTDCQKAQFIYALKNKQSIWQQGLRDLFEDGFFCY
ncbi:MAG: hypothetical protein IKC59_04290, partial [Clostridia bacterium]|nr:hypothetical protein [Clostridia bacterium]